jgi:hypothetical protein
MFSVIRSWNTLKWHRNNFFFIDLGIRIALIAIAAKLSFDWFGAHFFLDLRLKAVAVITAFIFCSQPANVIIKKLLEAFSIELPQEGDKDEADRTLLNAGKLIGIVERFLALALILMGEYEAVGLILAAKSILRFNRTDKSEYVLVGTLLSFSLAIFVGMLVNFA